MKATTSDTFDSISNTCRRFKSLLEERKEDILPMVHIDFPEKVYNDLPRRSNKVKFSVKNLSMCFGPASGIIKCISNGIGKKNWRSAWLFQNTFDGKTQPQLVRDRARILQKQSKANCT